jgi:hypothetical protein
MRPASAIKLSLCWTVERAHISRRLQISLAGAALTSPTGTTFHNLISSSVMARIPRMSGIGASRPNKRAVQLNARASKPEPSRKRPAMVTARNVLEANSSRMVLIPRGERIWRRASGSLCEVVFADFSQACPAILAVKYAEKFPHDRTPLFDRGLDIRRWFQGVCADPQIWFRPHRSIVSCEVGAGERIGAVGRNLQRAIRLTRLRESNQ